MKADFYCTYSSDRIPVDVVNHCLTNLDDVSELKIKGFRSADRVQ